MGRLDGKNALVTGASRGIGRAIALQLIRDGAKVALNYRSGEAECHSLANEVSGIGGQVLMLRADVGNPKEARGLIGQVLEKWGRLDILVVGQAGNFGQANYSASKGAIIAFTKTAAIEYAKYNITVNALAPGFTMTDMLAKVSPTVQDQIKARIPMGRFGLPEEIAKAVAFLAAEGDYITGQQINVNGGVYM